MEEGWCPEWDTQLFLVVNSFAYGSIPFGTVVLMAALQTVPQDLYESAKIDGAGPWQMFRSITFPWIKSSFFIALVLTTINAFRVFDLIYVLTQGGPANMTLIIGWFIYHESFTNLNLGNGSVLAFTLTFITSALAVLYYKLMPTEEGM